MFGGEEKYNLYFPIMDVHYMYTIILGMQAKFKIFTQTGIHIYHIDIISHLMYSYMAV